MRRLLPDQSSSLAGTLQQSPHAVPENSKSEPGLLYSISPTLELQRAGTRSSGRAVSRSRAGSTSRPNMPPPPPPSGSLGAVPKKRGAVEEPMTPSTVIISTQPSSAAAATSVPPPAPPVSESKMSIPVHSLTRRSAPSRGVGALRPPVIPRPELFELYKTSLLGGMAAGSVDAPKRGAVGRLPAVGGGRPVHLDDVLANRRRVIALSDGDDTDF